MVVARHRPTKAIIDTTAITANIKNERARLPQDTALFAVVKANGYGHGAVETARAAANGGATGFCVATIDEGIELREAGIVAPILLLGVVAVSDTPLLATYDFSFPVASQEWLQEAESYLANVALTRPLKVHIKVDTGMGRIGFLDAQAVAEAASWVEAHEAFEWEGVFTHFSTADQADTAYWQQQHLFFQEVLTALPHLPKYIHTGNSATALWHEQAVGNMIRYGIAMYGLNPSGHALAAPFELKPALSLVSALIQVKLLEKGSGIGYGETYITPQQEWIGTVPIGYADGWLRKMQGFSVLVEGEYCEIVGRVCMDQLMIRLPREMPVGTKVTLIGENQGQQITMQDVADQLDTIHYEVACTLSSRVPREYKS
ncbi:alanine racemase [Enterococcus sp. 8G7_MSG3316]|uniref:Alanine racemase n=1 Tax=Candidatus Enterococcus testudinis TaxID=1834191 RepID=A0A242A9N7_9ENTE|nr:alanine racemase [Enterococcus sp. 8G7_MSG3316]OTN77662.1 alanine racemase [Enterococcus sp. 8G7_MSG3316]